MKAIYKVLISLILCTTAALAFASPIYRSAKVIVHNETTNNLTVRGFDALEGTWLTAQGVAEPAAGLMVGAMSNFMFGTESRDISVGTSGMLDLAIGDAQVVINWRTPWVGRSELDIHTYNPQDLAHRVSTYSEDPDNIVHIITFMPNPKAMEDA